MLQSLQESFGLVFTPSGLIPLIRIAWILVMGFVTMKLIDSGLKRLRLIVPPGEMAAHHRVEQRAETLRHILRSVSKAILFIVLLLTISSELGFSIAPVLASAGIAGLAIGFGAQSLVKDIIAGFFILFEDQYGVGDVVKIGDQSGMVERMTLRVTILRDLEGRVHVIPNCNIHTVTVFTKEWARAVVDVTVAHRENLDHVYEILARVGDRLAADFPDRVLEKPQVLGLEKMTDDGVTIRVVVKTPPLKQWEVAREWRKRIKEEFDRERVELPNKNTIIVMGDELQKR